MFSHSEAASYLLKRELVSAESLVGGDLVVLDASRRNRNFQVTSKEGPCYLLKQAPGADRGMGTLAHEAAVYQTFQSMSGNNRLQNYLPRFYGYDAEQHLLILELLRYGENFQEYHSRSGCFSLTLARAIGKALSTFHSITIGERTKPVDSVGLPWALSAHLADSRIFQRISSADLQLIRIVQHSAEFRKLLNDLRQDWQAEAFIHRDIKWDNCIVFARSNSGRKTRVKIVDWEFAGPGDPCWDAGSVFSNYLSFWLLSIPITAEEPPDRFLELSRYPLERMQPAMRAFWQAYVQGMALDIITAQQWLLRATRYGAARLIQTGFEHMQKSTHLPGNLICLLQLSLNILLGRKRRLYSYWEFLWWKGCERISSASRISD
jgi:aminoglycoside phosphotransferase (APT) family kinase protein